MKVYYVILGVCLFGAFTCWKSIASDSVVDDLFLKNVEALADGEHNLPVDCEFSGNYTCPIGGEKVGFVYKGYGLVPDEEAY